MWGEVGRRAKRYLEFLCSGWDEALLPRKYMEKVPGKIADADEWNANGQVISRQGSPHGGCCGSPSSSTAAICDGQGLEKIAQ